jgi:heptosyltransferase-3
MGDSLLGRDIRSIVVVKLRHIGDVLLSTPAFHALRGAFPGARIAAVVNEETQEMLSGNPDIDRVLAFRRGRRDAGGKSRIGEELALLGELRSLRAECAVNLTEGDRGAILCTLSGARFRVGVAPARRGLWGKERLYTHLCPRPDLYRHQVWKDLDVLAAAGIPPDDLSLRFHFSEREREESRRKLSAAGVPGGVPYAVVQPTSRWKFKCWTEEGMAGVVAHLSRIGVFPVVTSGPDPAEIAQADRVADTSGSPCASLAGNLSLKELGAAISSARVFVGVDSAPMHIAAAVGTPVVALFGPTGAFNWAPWEGFDWGYTAERPAGTRRVGRHTVVQQEPESPLPGNDRRGGTGKGIGMEEITLGQVVDEIDRILERCAERRGPTECA